MVAVGATGWWKEEKEKLTRGRRLSKSPWVSLAADLQARVCGCCFVLHNKLLGVREVAGSRERSARGGPGGERWPAGRIFQGGNGEGCTQDGVFPPDPDSFSCHPEVSRVSKGRYK